MTTSNERVYDQKIIYDLQKWLGNLYGEDPCPILQPDYPSIADLLRIKSKNEEIEKNVREEIKSKKTLIKFYNEKSHKMRSLIDSEGVSLSEEAMKQVRSIAELAVKLNLEEPLRTNFLLAIFDMKNKILKNQEQKLNSCFVKSSLSKRIVRIQKQNELLNRDLNSLEKIIKIQEPSINKINDTLAFMNIKSEEYNQEKKLSEKFLQEEGFDPSLKHNVLAEESEKVQAIEDQLKKLLAKLNSFKELAPNEDLTKLEIQKKKEDLKLLEEKLNSLITIYEQSKTE